MNWNKKSELTYGILKTMYCRGGTDITGEWIPLLGQYYDYINNWIYNINHNYQVKIYKQKENEWHLMIYLCLTACNSDEVKLFDDYYTTKKEASRIAIDFIKEYDSSEKSWNDIENWKQQHAKPVFRVNDNDIVLIGTTYGSIGSDKNSKNHFNYYNDDLPQYSCGYYYELNKDLDSVFAWKYDLSTWGYTASGVKEKTLIDKMINIIKDIPKYQHFIDFINQKEK